MFDVDTTGFVYVKLETLYQKDGEGHVYPVRAIYINTKSHFGEAPVIATDKEFVNLPTAFTDEAKGILSDDEAIAEIKAGVIGFTIRTYMHPKYNRLCYTIDFVDING